MQRPFTRDHISCHIERAQREGSVVRGLATHFREATAPEPPVWPENVNGPHPLQPVVGPG